MTGFKDVVGRKDLVSYIQKAVTQNQISHAYILNGERGSGKKMFAQLFAMTLQCERGGPEPCNECHSCRQALSGNHPDIIRVVHEKPNTISVEEVRTQINNDIMIRPYNGKYKIYIVPDADMMTTQAQNALLKTIEEPPEYAVIFLLTENADSLLPTILSRCVMLKIKNVKDALIKKYLMEQMQIPDYQADVCTAFAQGNMGKAIKDMELPELLKTLKSLTSYKMEINDILDLISVWYRDVLLYKATKDINGVIFSDQMKYIKEQANTSSYEGIETILKALETAKVRLKANVNFELVMELLLLTIKEN